MKSKARLSLLVLFPPLVVVGIAAWGMTNGEAASSAPPSAVMVMPTPESWLLLPTLPISATQADVGANVYRLVCQACHGDQGQGLTDAWRATWAPSDQNCWQSKCHASNHPPEGFELPHWAPPIIGQGMLARFQTAEDLHAFLKERMPWHAPGSLPDENYWQLTAYLARANGLFDDKTVLAANNAANVRFWPEQPASPIEPSPSNTPVFPWQVWGVVLLTGAAVSAGLLYSRRRS